MKRSQLVVSSMIATAVILTACGGAPGPASAAKAWYEAFFQFDLNKVRDLTCEKVKPTIDEALSFFGNGDIDLSALNDQFKIDISGLKFEEISVSGDQATVRISGVLKVSAFGQSDERSVDAGIPVVNEDGVWKVCTSRLLGE